MKSVIRNLQIMEQKALVIAMKLFILSFFIGLTANSFAEQGDELMVIGSIVNLRAAPSTSAETLIKLLKNHKVTEIQRQNNWVEVNTHRDDIKKGWIYETLVSDIAAEDDVFSKYFEIFLQRFNERNRLIKKKTDKIYFSEVTNKGDGQLEIFATQAWIELDVENRKLLLDEVFDLWSENVPEESSISISIVDKRGQQYIKILRHGCCIKMLI